MARISFLFLGAIIMMVGVWRHNDGDYTKRMQKIHESIGERMMHT